MEIKPLAGLTTWVCRMLELSIAAAAATIVWSIFEYRKLSQMLPESDPTDAELVSSDIVLLGFLPFVVLIAVVTGVMFLMWIFRANKNLRALSGVPMRFTPGWSVGWYFIPFAHLFKPYQAMKEIWRVSHRDELERDNTNLLGAWWMLWIISMMLGRISLKLEWKAATAAEELTATWVSMLDDAIAIVLCIVALALVKRIAAAYERNFGSGRVIVPPPLPSALPPQLPQP